jgi:hypothetical protein
MDHFKEFYILVDELLAEQRPDRYEPTEAEWIDGVTDQVKHLIPASKAVYLAARAMVARREQTKMQQTNKLLRQIHESGQIPLDWLDTSHLPLAVSKKERVALRACTPQDFEDFANRERRSAMKESAARHETCEAANWIADQMRGNGWGFGRDIQSE